MAAARWPTALARVLALAMRPELARASETSAPGPVLAPEAQGPQWTVAGPGLAPRPVAALPAKQAAVAAAQRQPVLVPVPAAVPARALARVPARARVKRRELAGPARFPGRVPGPARAGWCRPVLGQGPGWSPPRPGRRAAGAPRTARRRACLAELSLPSVSSQLRASWEQPRYALRPVSGNSPIDTDWQHLPAGLPHIPGILGRGVVTSAPLATLAGCGVPGLPSCSRFSPSCHSARRPHPGRRPPPNGRPGARPSCHARVPP